jgi:hypothetical protein
MGAVDGVIGRVRGEANGIHLLRASATLKDSQGARRQRHLGRVRERVNAA